MSKVKKIFEKAGGINLIKQYLRMNVFLYACFALLITGFSHKSLEIFRLLMEKKIIDKLRKKYRRFIAGYEINKVYSPNNEKYIWICWFQGEENMPDIVKVCYNSIKKHLSSYNIILITYDNFDSYVNIPDYIIDKYQKGIISNAHFSDILRLELLIRYGGIWIDATVLCTDNNIPKAMLDSDLFIFQTLKPGVDGHTSTISNWYISACQNNKILSLTRDLLYEYWNKNNFLIDYFIFHNFFVLACEKYDNEWKKVLPFTNETPHILLLNLDKKYDKDSFDAIVNQSCFHKLSYKLSDEVKNNHHNIYNYLLKDKENINA